MTETQITDPPAVFLQKLGAMNDVKKLENIHRILHAWAAEIRSPSPKTYIGTGWSASTIQAAHEAVVRRLKTLKPNFDHKSPITGARPMPHAPVMVVPNYISLVGSRYDGNEDSDADIVIREKEPDESLLIRLTQLFGEDIHYSFNEKGPHDLDFKGLYHLALVPVDVWDELDRHPISAAMTTYKKRVGAYLTEPSCRTRILQGAGLLRSKITGVTPLEDAMREGETAAQWFFSEGPLPEMLMGAGWDTGVLYKEAKAVYVGLLGEVTDFLDFGAGLREIYEQIAEWKKNDPFKDEDEAKDAARELGSSVAKKHGEKQ